MRGVIKLIENKLPVHPPETTYRHSCIHRDSSAMFLLKALITRRPTDNEVDEMIILCCHEDLTFFLCLFLSSVVSCWAVDCDHCTGPTNNTLHGVNFAGFCLLTLNKHTQFIYINSEDYNFNDIWRSDTEICTQIQGDSRRIEHYNRRDKHWCFLVAEIRTTFKNQNMWKKCSGYLYNWVHTRRLLWCLSTE